MTSIKDKTIVVWFSCGAASAVAAKKSIELYGADNTIRVVNNPIAEEDPDNRRFLKDVEKWLGVEIESCTHPKFPNCSIVEVFDKRKFMSGPKGAPCTSLLKIEARKLWEKTNDFDYLVMGFTVDEKDRSDSFIEGERANLIPVLIDLQITKKQCYKIILDAGIALPDVYLKGMPNANCIGCVKATSPTYCNHVREVFPIQFAERAEQSRRIGAKLVRVKNVRLFLDELDPLAMGRPMKDTVDFECGLFCEEFQNTIDFGDE